MPSRGKRTIVAAGAAAVLVLGSLALSWREIAVRWLLRGLRAEPDRLSAELSAEEGSLAAEAAARFARTEEGRSALARLYVTAVLDALDRPGGRPGEAGMMAADRTVTICWRPPGLSWTIQVFGRDGASAEGNDALVRKAVEVLAAGPRACRTLAIDRLPGFEVAVLPYEWVAPFYRIWWMNESGEPSAGHPCILALKTGARKPPSPCLAAPLLRASKEPDKALRRIAGEELDSLGIAPVDPAPGLIAALLRDPLWTCEDHLRHPWLQLEGGGLLNPAAAGLMEVGPSALPSLTAALKANPENYSAAAMSMWVYERIGTDSIPFLSDLETARDPILAATAHAALERVREKPGREPGPAR